MKYLTLSLALVALFVAVPGQILAQWECVYATYDDADSNGTGDNTTAVGVIHENMFVAMCAPLGASSGATTGNFMIPYVNASADLGRVYSYGYSPATSNLYQVWSDGAFDQVTLNHAVYCRATADSLIYVPNNDEFRNLLVFKYVNDTVTVVPNGNGVYPRIETGNSSIHAVDVDQDGYVYVCRDTTTGRTDDVLIYPPVSAWTGATTATTATIDLPDGIYKGVAVSPDGHSVYVSDFTGRQILKFEGSRTGTYSAVPGFSFALGAADTITGVVNLPRITSLQYMAPNNILFAAVDSWGSNSAFRSYNYGRIYLINTNNGALASPDSSVSIIDQAMWNFIMLDSSYTNRVNGKEPINASGYASTWDVKLDEKGNVYSQSYNGWTVEKWRFNGSLPVITGVREIGGTTPDAYRLLQNYPNPFNPATTIEFSLKQSGFVKLTVSNIIGQEVATLVNEVRNAGAHRVTFDARSLPSGSYFYSITVNGYKEVRKMLLVK
jgi:hypothetical protein